MQILLAQTTSFDNHSFVYCSCCHFPFLKVIRELVVSLNLIIALAIPEVHLVPVFVLF